MATAPRRFPPAPFTAPISGDIDQRLSQIATEINRKADSTAEPVFSAVLFRATDGSTWRMRISPTGAVLLDQVDV
jgi:hypothetical protein